MEFPAVLRSFQMLLLSQAQCRDCQSFPLPCSQASSRSRFPRRVQSCPHSFLRTDATPCACNMRSSQKRLEKAATQSQTLHCTEPITDCRPFCNSLNYYMQTNPISLESIAQALRIIRPGCFYVLVTWNLHTGKYLLFHGTESFGISPGVLETSQKATT